MRQERRIIDQPIIEIIRVFTIRVPIFFVLIAISYAGELAEIAMDRLSSTRLFRGL